MAVPEPSSGAVPERTLEKMELGRWRTGKQRLIKVWAGVNEPRSEKRANGTRRTTGKHFLFTGGYRQ